MQYGGPWGSTGPNGGSSWHLSGNEIGAGYLNHDIPFLFKKKALQDAERIADERYGRV
jgi:hypothetical protein